MDKEGYSWSMPVAVEEIPETGLHLTLEAPAEAREAVAREAGLRTLPKLTAVFDLERRGADVRVSGQVSARVGQTCGVTLEPMESDVEETVDLVFSPAAAAETEGKTKPGEEPPEPLVGGQIDLGAVATEFLMLGIDPYPRKEGARFNLPQSEEARSRPFAALEALKSKAGRKA
jgi:uncharacterized metal-binding protein YceD (DUF177 family)